MYTVFEADATSTVRPRDWDFGIYWAQSPLADCLPAELVAEVENSQVDDHKPSASDIMPLYNAETCELISEIPAPYSLRLQRRKWLRLISQGIDIEVCWSIVFSTVES